MIAVKKADEVDENLVQENPGLHIEFNQDERELNPPYICSLWTQLMKLVGINLIDANSSQPIMLPEDHQAFFTILTALGSNLDNFPNWFHTHTPIDTTPMKPLPPMVHIQCYLLGEYICSHNYSPKDLHCALVMKFKPGSKRITHANFLPTLISPQASTAHSYHYEYIFLGNIYAPMIIPLKIYTVPSVFTGDEVEAWSQEPNLFYFLAHAHLFHLRQVQHTLVIMSTIPTETHSPMLSQ